MYFENPYSLNFESDWGDLLNQSSQNVSGRTENWGSGSKPVKESLVLDGEKGELEETSGRMGKKSGASETKMIAALKSHSEAERRRRERINAHLMTLRGLVPNNEKMDKATLLAEVINQVKQLKATATQANEGLHIPMDADEVEVEILKNNEDDGSFLLRASLCCNYKPDLMYDLKQAINDLPVQVLKCELSTLGGRLKSVFLITTREGDSDSVAGQELIVSSVRMALSNILDKVTASAEYDQELFYPQKRRRLSCFDAS
ncbi:hypothetical protein CDL12_14331 [Handroanthus impetiginosus]|uniref:BHLH domain-containing protein n=1 Tax=Handroanthus impetiginosus TaxID=429701 RepID=A0A2G9H6A1_9LAMI|nr:hypothetical protein CDL12_14331 [Handroanthus impetiginosus]